ncbi:hypothetical protein [Daejeonella sp.]|jgi:hypothetical protein|uniref:hypothetical protein n=1 Tax=Daejeonella sp. TaxID=2805397 RepID=UPI0037834B4C
MKIKIGLLVPITLLLLCSKLYAQVGIGTNTPAASAALEVASSTNNKGILIPRITATQKDAINNPAEGLMIYQTSAPAGFYYYMGSAWKLIMTQTDLDTKLSTVDATTSLNTKVDKVAGKELSSNDYTTTEKTKLAAITGSNTGDQDLSALATITSVALKANTTDVATSLASKVDKVAGKELSSNDYSTAEKTKLAAIIGNNTGDQDLSSFATTNALALKANTTDVSNSLTNKVDKVSGKELSTNDYTSAEKTKLAAITGSNTGDQDLSALATITSVALKANTTDVATSLASKVDKVTGKDLSSNDYTTTEKTKLAAITGSNTGDQNLSALATIASVALKANTTDVNTSLDSKVDKVTGKELSSNDYTTVEKTKLAAITGSNTGDQDLSTLATTASVALKANITDVNTDLALKANTAELTNSLALKAPLASPNLVTPNIGVATGTSLSVSGQLTSTIAPGAAPLVVSSTTPVANLSIGGNAATATLASTVTTNADLTGDVTSSGSNVTTIGASKVTNAMLAGSIDLTSKVIGILPSSNGGTGNGFTNITGPTTSVKTFTLPDASATILTSNATVSVAQGGTGASTLTANNVLLGNGADALQAVAPGTNGNVLTSNGTTWASTAPSGGLPTTGNMSGDMLYWNGTAWVKVAPSQYEGAYLQSKSGVPTWLVSSGVTTAVVDVTNPTTGKIWMDRNLGATRVANDFYDHLSYGDLYQWGRGRDGHQNVVWTSSTASDGAEQNKETITLSSTDVPGNGNFILAPNSPYDWRSGQNVNLWQGVIGINNPCPSGYRLPTEPEWEAERVSWTSQNNVGAFASPLKLPVAGYRYSGDGSFFGAGSYGFYWSSTVSGTVSRGLLFGPPSFFGGSNASMIADFRAIGFSVRCLKD